MLEVALEPTGGAEEGGADLGDELLHRVGRLAEAPAELAVQALRMTRPVHDFMKSGGVVAPRVGEELALGQLYAVVRRAVEGGEAAVLDPGAGIREQPSGACSGSQPFGSAAGCCSRSGSRSTCSTLKTVKLRRSGTTRGSGRSSASEAGSSWGL
jgi:hypothetical protein